MKVGGGGGAQGEYVLCPAGNYPGVIVGIFDIGWQKYTGFDGTTREDRKLVLVFELAKKRPDGKPFILAERYTWSMNEKANFYKLVVNITGSRFRDGDNFDPRTLSGKPVMINVTNSQNGEKTYHNIGSASQFPEGFPPPAATIAPILWSVATEEPLPVIADTFPFIYGQSIRSLADDSAEAKRRREGANGPSSSATKLAEKIDGRGAVPDSDIPF
jgi:hypothetical protein